DEIAAPIARVWARFADFGHLSGWAPGAPKVEVEGSGVGAVRSVTNEGQPQIRERLERYDAAAHTFSYSMLESPFPFTDYLATVKLTDRGGNRTGIDWSSTFEPRGMPAERTVEVIENLYRLFISRLKETLAAG